MIATNAGTRLRQSVFAGPSGPSEDMIQTLTEWQNTTDPSDGWKLSKQPWPKQYQKYSGTLYRVMALSADRAIEACTQGLDINKPSSWTKSLKVIREFAGERWFIDLMNDRGATACVVILSHRPQGNQVILDVDAVWKDKSFKSWVEDFENRGTFFSEGREFEDSQEEVICSGVRVKPTEIQVIPFWLKKWEPMSASQFLKEVPKYRNPDDY